MIDVPKEISDQGFNTAKVITFFATAYVAVIAFASLVVVSDYGASVGRPVIEPTPEAVRTLWGRPGQLPQHHFSNGAIRIYKPGPKNERGGRRHMVAGTIARLAVVEQPPAPIDTVRDASGRILFLLDEVAWLDYMGILGK